MPSQDDPGAARSVRKVSKTRTFKHGHVDPVIEMKRPLLTWGNAVLAAIMVTFGLYATGNLPEIDQFFNFLDSKARSKNDTVVHGLIQYGSMIVMGLLGLFACWLIFLFINGRRRNLSDRRKEWVDITDQYPERRQRVRRALGAPDEQPAFIPRNAAAAATPAELAAIAAAAAIADIATSASPAIALATAAAVPPPATPTPINSVKAEAIAAATRAETAAANAPTDLPSFVVPIGKVKKAGGGTQAIDPTAPIDPTPIVPAPIAPATPTPVVAATPKPKPVYSAKAAAIANAAKAEAATDAAVPDTPSFVAPLGKQKKAGGGTLAVEPVPFTPTRVSNSPPLVTAAPDTTPAAQAAAAMAAAQAEVAKAELAMALARVEAAKAEAALLAAKLETPTT